VLGGRFSGAKMLGFCAVVLVMTASDWSAFPGDGAFANGSEHTHDPAVIEFQGTYVSISTSGQGMGVVKTTRDFKTWKFHGPLLKENPDWLKKRIPEHRSVWAPDIVVYGKKVRVYYCASRFFGGNDSVIGFLENDQFDPTKPTEGWVDRGEVIDSRKDRNFYNCIDAEILIDQAKRHWLFFGSYYAGIYCAELNPESGKLLDPVQKPPFLVARNTASKENALEGSCVMFKEGWYYLYVSYGLAAQGVRSTYQIMVGRSKDPTGPFLDASGKAMTEGGHVNFLKTSPPMFSPGHNEVFQDSKGRWLTSYHYYDGRKYWTDGKWGLPRVQVREIFWDQDGWPLPGLPLEHLATQKLTARKTFGGKWIHQADFANADEVEFLAGGIIKVGAGDRQGKWSLEKDLLVLRWPKKESTTEFWEDKVTLHHQGNYYVGRTLAGLVVRGYRVQD
jgi:arabinan endo-1,5-alpha-L-arabinosidase